MAPTVEYRLDLSSNALNAIRLCLALCVIVSHSFPISGAGPDPGFGGISLGTTAVGGFFAISGYLITRSRLKSGLGSYAWRRFLRIFPGYWVCLVFTAFVAAAIGGHVRGGWSPGNAAAYVLSYADMSGPSPLAAHALAGSPFPGSWNGSLWSLRYEVGCYVAVGLALTVPWLWRQTWVSLLAFGLATAAKLAIDQAGGGRGLVGELALLLPFFLAGVLILRFADRLPLTGRGALVAAAALGGGLLLHRGEALAPVPLAYIVLWAGATAPAALKRIGARNDISYGTYLYAFPIQQLLVLAGLPRLGVGVFIGVSVIATVPLAAASWFAVERPAMMARHLPARWRRGASLTGPTRATEWHTSAAPEAVPHVVTAEAPPQ